MNSKVQISHDALYRRINVYGYTQEEALNVPPHQPRWQWHLEKHYGRPLREVLTEWRDEGRTLRDFCRKHNMAPSTVSSWLGQWGIQFKPGVRKAGLTFPQRRALEILAREVVLETEDLFIKAISGQTIDALEVRDLVHRDDYGDVRLTERGEKMAEVLV